MISFVTIKIYSHEPHHRRTINHTRDVPGSKCNDIYMEATAIKDHSLGRFKQGDEFTIQGVKYLKCGCVLFDVGIRYLNYNVHTTCKHGTRMSSIEIGWYASYMFTPTSEVKEAIYGLLQGNSTNKERGY